MTTAPSSVIPLVIDALVALAETTKIDGTFISDGYPVTDDPDDYLAIAVDDPDNPEMSDAASSDVDWAHTGSGAMQEERGIITCCAVAAKGSGNAKDARDKAFAMKDALAAAYRSDLDIGVGYVSWTVGRRNQYRAAQTEEDGAVAYLLFDLYFVARL